MKFRLRDLEHPGVTAGQGIVSNGAAWFPGMPWAEAVSTVTSSGSTETLVEPSVATIHYVTLDANCTLTFPTATAGTSFTLVLIQDGTGSRTVTWPSSVRWAGGTAPTLTTTAAKRDVLSFLCADGSTWLAFVAGQAYS